jgi:hypothetical protein
MQPTVLAVMQISLSKQIKSKKNGIHDEILIGKGKLASAKI